MAAKKADLAIVLGPPPGGEGPGSELEAEAQAAMADALPDLAADPERLEAFWQAVRLYMQSQMGDMGGGGTGGGMGGMGGGY